MDLKIACREEIERLLMTQPFAERERERERERKRKR
jgi:hypothetical protein